MKKKYVKKSLKEFKAISLTPTQKKNLKGGFIGIVDTLIV